jgi:hypothetical protein
MRRIRAFDEPSVEDLVDPGDLGLPPAHPLRRPLHDVKNVQDGRRGAGFDELDGIEDGPPPMVTSGPRWDEGHRAVAVAVGHRDDSLLCQYRDPGDAALAEHGPFPGADDGIRTRDPHLGKVPGTGSVTWGDGRIRPVKRALSFSCNRDGSRRFPFGDGTPTGPLAQSGLSAQAGRHEPRNLTEAQLRSDRRNRTAGGDVAPSVGKVSFAIPLLLKMLEDIRVNH